MLTVFVHPLFEKLIVVEFTCLCVFVASLYPAKTVAVWRRWE
jgi:hypothetical protein